VTDDDDPVGGKVHIELQPVGTRRQPAFERGDGVLGTKRAAASMGKHAGPRRRFEEGHD
jgi:hypothetical protein